MARTISWQLLAFLLVSISRCLVDAKVSLRSASISQANSTDCFQDPTVCKVKPFEICYQCGDAEGGKDRGCCKVAPNYADCYRNPGVCPKGTWCQLQDHKSFNETEFTTIGRCITYQKECYSCHAVLLDDNPPVVPALNAEAFLSPTEEQPGKDFGSYLDRVTRCDPDAGLTCTGSLVPALPPTCVKSRKLPHKFDGPTRENLLNWGKRLMRMGARNLENRIPDRGPGEQMPQGNSREDVHKGVNMIIQTLWNAEFWGDFEELKIESTSNELCCLWDNYTAQLSDFQKRQTKANWRNPVDPYHAETGNAPPCVWCQFDGAYNDENPSVWSLIHALTFNLPDQISELQLQVLRSLPLFLRQHLSCPLCRSHIKEHLIDLGIPNSNNAKDWAYFFWKAHNYVNEQSEVTRCGSQSCGWGVFQTPPLWQCAGSYRYPWFMTFPEASKQWRVEPFPKILPKVEI